MHLHWFVYQRWYYGDGFGRVYVGRCRCGRERRVEFDPYAPLWYRVFGRRLSEGT